MKNYDKEGDIKGNIKVSYKNNIYVTGNRYHGLVELYRDNKFVITVKQDKLKIL